MCLLSFNSFPLSSHLRHTGIPLKVSLRYLNPGGGGGERSPGTFILPFIAFIVIEVKFLIFIFHRSRLSVISVYHEALAGDSVEIVAADECSGSSFRLFATFWCLGKVISALPTCWSPKLVCFRLAAGTSEKQRDTEDRKSRQKNGKKS